MTDELERLARETKEAFEKLPLRERIFGKMIEAMGCHFGSGTVHISNPAYDQFFAAIDAAIAECKPKWLPIEDAKKGGREVLALWPQQGNVVELVRWSALRGYWVSKGKPVISMQATLFQHITLPEAKHG